MEIRAIIMAGGAGTRFWPLSRKKIPKQFLPIVSEKTMIEETVLRLLPLLSPDKIYTVANLEQTQAIGKFLPKLPPENLLVEPQGKNTAPSLMLATASILLKNPEALVAALPADHLISNPSLFLKKLKAGASLAAEGFLITFGIPPTYAATGYGYIHFSEDNPRQIQDESFYTVKEFKEKPEFEQANQFLKEGNYYWNSGMFLWEARIFARKLEKYAPSLFSYWERMLDALKKENNKEIKSIFEEIPAISIDYALMEKAKEGVLVCPGNFGWSDVGSWSSLLDIWPKDKNGNAIKGESIIFNSRNCLSYSPHKLTALIGVEDIIVVETGDVLLVCHKDLDQRVRDIVDSLKKKGEKEYL
jgi:mannose-1-phosphate guanylyltransferase